MRVLSENSLYFHNSESERKQAKGIKRKIISDSEIDDPNENDICDDHKLDDFPRNSQFEHCRICDEFGKCIELYNMWQ